MTRITVDFNNETVFDAFLEYGEGSPVTLEGNETSISTEGYVDVEIDGEPSDEPWATEFSIELNGEVEYTEHINLDEAISITLSDGDIESFTIDTISVIGEKV